MFGSSFYTLNIEPEVRKAFHSPDTRDSSTCVKSTWDFLLWWAVLLLYCHSVRSSDYDGAIAVNRMIFWGLIVAEGATARPQFLPVHVRLQESQYKRSSTGSTGLEQHSDGVLMLVDDPTYCFHPSSSVSSAVFKSILHPSPHRGGATDSVCEQMCIETLCWKESLLDIINNLLTNVATNTELGSFHRT